jgi:hypothetical protein
MFSSHLSCIYYFITLSPWEKDVDFVIRIFIFLRFFYFRFSLKLRQLPTLTPEGERLLDVDSLSRDLRGFCIDRGNERKDIC